MPTSVQSRSWVQRSLLMACFVAVAAYGYVITYLREFHFRDFDVHREVGRLSRTGCTICVEPGTRGHLHRLTDQSRSPGTECHHPFRKGTLT